MLKPPLSRILVPGLALLGVAALALGVSFALSVPKNAATSLVGSAWPTASCVTPAATPYVPNGFKLTNNNAICLDAVPQLVLDSQKQLTLAPLSEAKVSELVAQQTAWSQVSTSTLQSVPDKSSIKLAGYVLVWIGADPNPPNPTSTKRLSWFFIYSFSGPFVHSTGLGPEANYHHIQVYVDATTGQPTTPLFPPSSWDSPTPGP